MRNQSGSSISQLAAAAAVAVLALTVATLSAQADEKEQKVDPASLPAAVRATAEAQAPGGKIVEAELEEEKGQKLYSVDVKKADGSKVEFEIGLDGVLLKTENEDDDEGEESEEAEQKIELSQAPAAVQTAVNAIVQEGGTLTALVQEKEGKATIYEAEYTVGGVPHSLELGANGAILEQEAQISTATLSADISAAIQAAYPGAQIKEAEEVTVHFLEFDIVVNGKTKEIKVSPSGDVISGDEDDDEDEDDDDDEDEDDDEDDEDDEKEKKAKK